MTCQALSLVNGQINYNEPAAINGDYPVGTVASFTCTDNYYLSGSESITCQTSGDWNQETSACKSKGRNIFFIKCFQNLSNINTLPWKIIYLKNF